jgi:hypothetical protein
MEGDTAGMMLWVFLLVGPMVAAFIDLMRTPTTRTY